MYNKLDYLNRGMRLLNNRLLPRRKKLSSLYLYTTTLCNSQCKHCLIWQKRPVVTMTKDKVIEIMQSKCITRHTTIGLEGGEFILHPQYMDILKWFSQNHRNFDLLTNCLLPEKVIEAVKKTSPRHLYVSLDGDRDTYKHMRGTDGYDKVIRVVEACAGHLPVSFMFTLSPYNSFRDMEFVVNLAKRYAIDVRIGIYNNIHFFDTGDKAHTKGYTERSNFSLDIPECVKQTSENYDFILLYDEWRKGNLRLNCHSTRDSLVIHPNGDVPLCQHKDVMLGNIYEKNLDDIFNSASTCRIHKQYSRCNDCWINFHRKYDIVLIRTAERFVPKKLIELFYGEYKWCEDREITYSKLLTNREGRKRVIT